MDALAGQLAVVTGGGSGMGRELVRQLGAQGCSVAACAWNAAAVAATVEMARAGAPDSVRVSSHACDVSDEAQVQRFRDELVREHRTDHVGLVFSGSGRLVQAMLADGPVDELHLFLYPVTRAAGPRLFPEGAAPGKLSLTGNDTFENGVVYLAYRPQA